MALLIYLVLLTLLRSQIEAYNNTSSEKSSQEELVFGYLTLTATIVVSIIAVILIGCTIMTCCFDFNKMKQGIGNLEVCEDEGTEERTRTLRVTSPSAEPLLSGEERSYEDSVQSAAKLSDFASDLVQISKLSTAAPRLDAEAKQARIIEAIYQASGREVPEMYRSKTRSKQTFPLPAIAIRGTVEGIAEKEEPEPGSPVTALFSLPQKEPSAPNNQTNLTDSPTMRKLWPGAIKLSAAPTGPSTLPVSSTPLTTPLATARSPLQKVVVPVGKDESVKGAAKSPSAKTLSKRKEPTGTAPKPKQSGASAPDPSQKRPAAQSSKESSQSQDEEEKKGL